MYTLSTTIKLSKETKAMLTDLLIELERELGRRLSYDDVIRILASRAGARNPECLQTLMRMKVPEELTEKARRLLEGETVYEEEVFRRRYRSRHERSS